MTTIYFDSRYLLCRLEVGLLRRLAAPRAVNWQDLNAPDFDAATLGMDDSAMRRALHLQNDQGWVIGADAAYRLFARCHARQE
ncbi:MAG TPA: DCC1-like thiol-disulfide oxidoreductase family protein [Chitinolyticbacter sp.]|nr:DCC1-like thiol-disulfide oxidoreductase family protein [Chitinolyticbacter sp.]